MKLFYLLSDVNAGLIITGIFSIATLLVTLVVIPMLNRILNKQAQIHNEINGMKSELVQATRELGEAVGKAQGRAELRTELGLNTETPSEVIVIENKDKNVIIEKNLDK